MSHYISANAEGWEVVLSNGLSGASIDAFAATGFDLYAAYDARQFKAGWSGSGESASVPADVAREALVASVAWAMAVLKYCEKHLSSATRDAVSPSSKPLSGIAENLEWISEEFPTDIDEEALESARSRSESLLERLNERSLDWDELYRVTSHLMPVVRFTSAVARKAAEGQPVSIVFV